MTKSLLKPSSRLLGQHKLNHPAACTCLEPSCKPSIETAQPRKKKAKEALRRTPRPAGQGFFETHRTLGRCPSPGPESDTDVSRIRALAIVSFDNCRRPAMTVFHVWKAEPSHRLPTKGSHTASSPILSRSTDALSRRLLMLSYPEAIVFWSCSTHGFTAGRQALRRSPCTYGVWRWQGIISHGTRQARPDHTALGFQLPQLRKPQRGPPRLLCLRSMLETFLPQFAQPCPRPSSQT